MGHLQGASSLVSQAPGYAGNVPLPAACGHPQTPPQLRPPLPVPCGSRRAHPRVVPQGPPDALVQERCLGVPPLSVPRCQVLRAALSRCSNRAWAACSPRGFLFCCYPKVKEPLRSWSHPKDSARRGMVRNGPSTFAVT